MNNAMTVTRPRVPSSTTSLVPTRALPPSRALASVRTTGALVPPADPATDLALRSLSNRLESLGGSRYALTGPFPDADRARLEARADELAALLQPGSPADILRSVGMLRTIKGEVALEGEARTALMNAHLALLDHVPAWTIEAVCKAFMRSRDRFAPDPGVIADACEVHLVPVRAELRRIEHVLNAETDAPVTDAEREEVAGLCANLIAELARKAQADDDRTGHEAHRRGVERAEAAAHLATLAAKVAGSEAVGEVKEV